MFISDEQKNRLKEFESFYNFDFSDKNLLYQAFVHTSYTNENSLDIFESYERLEFLGDAVLKLCISKFLYKTYPKRQEGELTALRGRIVSDKYIFEFAKKLGFDSLIILGKNEESHGGAHKESILACAFEAFLGAIFLDYKEDGYKKAYDFLIENFKDEILDVENHIAFLNPKAKLQEYTQSIDKTLPVYRKAGETGASHDKTFFVEVLYNNKVIAKGCAKTIKEAQQEAAYNALKELGVING